MRRIKLSSLLLILSLSACVNFPNEYAPPQARRPDSGPDPRRLDAFLNVTSGSSAKHFGAGIDLAAFDGVTRKAGPRAVLRFAADARAAWNFSLKLNSPAQQQIAVLVNGTKLGEFSASGAASWQAPVPAGTLVEGTAALVELQSASGFGLIEAGFVRR